MRAKSAYLTEGTPSKELFLAAFREGSEVLEYESTLRQGSPYTRDLLSTIPAVQWRDSRLRNLHHLTQQISDLDGLTVWPSTFGLILTTGDESKRDALHTALCAKRIYPAVLWPDTHDEASDREGGFSRRMLHVHTDQRYFDSDMDRVALVMRSAWDQIKDCP